MTSAEKSAISRAQLGISDVEMTGAWRVIIARTPERYVASYYHTADDPRLAAALRRNAERWLAAQHAKQGHRATDAEIRQDLRDQIANSGDC